MQQARKMNWIYAWQKLQGKLILYLIHQKWHVMKRLWTFTFPFPICIMRTYVSQIFFGHVSRICNVFNMLRKHINFMVTIYIKTSRSLKKSSGYFDDIHIIFNVFKCPICHIGLNILRLPATFSSYFKNYIQNIILMNNVLLTINHRDYEMFIARGK